MPKGLTVEKASQLRRKLKQYGSWTGVRWLRNQGVEFEHAYWLMFGRMPLADRSRATPQP